jgi:hypothetical protein
MKGGLDMDQTKSDKITLRVAPDVRRSLEHGPETILAP